MKQYLIILLAVLNIGFTACEEVIILELENAEPRLVIEAVVDVSEQKATFLITESNGFYESSTLKTIDNATVTLILGNGSTLNVPTQGNGVYTLENLSVSEGEVLSVAIVVEGVEYRATTTAPHSVQLDSLSAEEVTGFGPGNPTGNETSYRVSTFWTDVANKESFYKIKAIKNDTLQTEFTTLIEDVGNDGTSFFRPFRQTFSEGDTVTMQLFSLDKLSFRYFQELSAAVGQGFNSTTPFNPKSVFTNNALGYFTVVQKSEKNIVLD